MTQREQRFEEVVDALSGLPYEEATYQALVELAEEMRAVKGWQKHQHPNLHEAVVAVFEAREAMGLDS